VVDIVLDTNVLVATLLQPRGSNSNALRVIIGNPESFNICFSSIMLAEYDDVLSRPIITGRGLQEEAKGLLALLKDVGEEIIPKPVYALVYPDRTDRPFLEAAVYVNGLLLTNNLKDFPFAGVSVMEPEDFLAWLDTRI
jgi:putative PIN family toxin of toxin-antitoxin system